MTCIAGVVDEKEKIVFIGADSLASNKRTALVRADTKLFKRKDFLIGYTDSFRMGQLLRYNLNIPKIPKDMDLFEYMVIYFVEAVRGCLGKGGYTKKVDEQESGGTFLIGVKDRLFSIQSDFQVEESASGYLACGSGEDFALGSLHTTKTLALDSKKRIEYALSAAECHNCFVREPFYILNT